MNKGFFQYLAWLTVGYILLALASWCDDTWAATSKGRSLADQYVQATTDAVDKYLDQQHIIKDPSTRLKITMEVLRADYLKGMPSERACAELRRYTRKPCAAVYLEFWQVYHKLDEE